MGTPLVYHPVSEAEVFWGSMAEALEATLLKNLWFFIGLGLPFIGQLPQPCPGLRYTLRAWRK